MKNPKLIVKPFAKNGQKNVIPENYETSMEGNQATWDQGFGQITMLPVAAGGLPPKGQDFNGIFNQISENIVYLSQGGRFKFSAEYAESIGGYPKGAILQSDDEKKEYLSLIDSNKINFNVAPDISASWEIVGGSYATKADLTIGLNKKVNTSDVSQTLGNDLTKVPSLDLVARELGKKASTTTVDGKLAKDQNGADIPNKPKFIENLGLPELLNLKRDKTDTIFTSLSFKPDGAEGNLWLACDVNKKQFAIAINVNGTAHYIYFQNKGGSLALEEQITAQAILAKLLQVDGAGSGLDADLLRGLPADFGSSSSTNGYQKLPSGMIIQWGVSGQSPTDIYIKFPVAFTRQPLFIGESAHGGRYTTAIWTANEVTNVGFNATQVCVLSNSSDKVNPPGNYATNWLAIGF